MIPEDVKIIGQDAFNGTSPEILVIPNQVTTIKEYAFNNSDDLTTITIGKNVSSIEKDNFVMRRDYFKVTDVYSYAKTPPSLGEHVFTWYWISNTTNYSEYTSQVTLHVPASSIDLYRNADVWKDFNPIVALPDEGITTGLNEAAPQIDNGQLTIDNASDAWFTIDGRKLSGKPTKKGVYIHNGRAVVNYRQ